MPIIKKIQRGLEIYNQLYGSINSSEYKRIRQFFHSHDNYDFFNVPIFIISYNRLYCLQQQISRLKEMGYKNITIIDNNSSYPPLLEFLDTTDCKVIRMKKNFGHKVFWKSGLYKKYMNDLYVVTDPDVIPVENCPNDFVRVFYSYLKKYPRFRKVGFSLKINDIPDDSPLKEDVLAWEQKFYSIKVPFQKVFVASIDTTMALYMPDNLNISCDCLSALRTAEPYEARHLPWYKTQDKITEEDRYYADHRTNGFWDEAKGNLTKEGKDAFFVTHST